MCEKSERGRDFVNANKNEKDPCRIANNTSNARDDFTMLQGEWEKKTEKKKLHSIGNISSSSSSRRKDVNHSHSHIFCCDIHLVGCRNIHTMAFPIHRTRSGRGLRVFYKGEVNEWVSKQTNESVYIYMAVCVNECVAMNICTNAHSLPESTGWNERVNKPTNKRTNEWAHKHYIILRLHVIAIG